MGLPPLLDCPLRHRDGRLSRCQGFVKKVRALGRREGRLGQETTVLVMQLLRCEVPRYDALSQAATLTFIKFILMLK